MKRTICALVMFCFVLHASAASVLWNKAFIEDQNVHWDGFEHDKFVTMGYPYLNMVMDFVGDDLILTALPESNLANANSFVEANKGDVVDERYMASHFYFAYAEYGEWGNGRTWTDYNLTFSPGDNCYLAFSSESDTSTTYGWVQLGYTYGKELVVLSSVWNLDGESLIVGAIPEPSGGLLILFGSAALALRRRRRRE